MNDRVTRLAMIGSAELEVDGVTADGGDGRFVRQLRFVRELRALLRADYGFEGDRGASRRPEMGRGESAKSPQDARHNSTAR
jgi:hypothetical protein